MNLQFNTDGLIPVITQDFQTNEVLMLAYMNQEAFKKTKETGKVHYYSRSRNTLWLKGETSGHYQIVKKILYDCDADSLLILVEQIGGACHNGYFSCFYREVDQDKIEQSPVFSPEQVYSTNTINILDQIHQVVLDRKQSPQEGSYTNYLLEKGIDKTLKKVGEETAEVIIASKNPDEQELIYEIADLMYHLSVLMVQRDINWTHITKELEKRKK